MSASTTSSPRLGVAIVGLGGAVATTVAAGVTLLRAGAVETSGLPLAALDDALTRDLMPYGALTFGGWDFFDADLAEATLNHDVLSAKQFEAVRDDLARIRPWPGVGNERFCRNVTGSHQIATDTLADAVEVIQGNLDRFRDDHALDRLVVVNLASTEASPDLTLPVFADPDAFEAGLEADHEAISPAMLYAYAAIDAGVPYVNFTPSLACDVPALTQLAAERNVPVAGKDGKTGQTLVKTILAPGLRDRALEVEGWYSTNILGNRDGEALRDRDSLASKIQTKGSVLDSILGYDVEDHVVNISYYRPRGDNKEAWDNVDLVGFLGQRMQMKINFLCRDSILAAPLVIELVRLLELADRHDWGGMQEHLGVFFKSPMAKDGQTPVHGLPAQQRNLLSWLEDVHARGDGAAHATEPARDAAPGEGASGTTPEPTVSA